MPNNPSKPLQNTTPKNSLPAKAQKATEGGVLIEVKNGFPDTISFRIQAYFRFEATTSQSSRKEQHRDLFRFRNFMLKACGGKDRQLWTPRLSQAFKEALQKQEPAKGKKGYRDRTIKRVMAYLKTFAKWIHKLKPFPLGDPMAKMKLMPAGTGLEVERAITLAERRRILDAADSLPVLGSRSKDRHRYRCQERPQRKGCRPYRNRAVVYTLTETGMRRAAVRSLDLKDVSFKQKSLTVEEKGGLKHKYKITRQGLAAIQDYLAHERKADAKKWRSPEGA